MALGGGPVMQIGSPIVEDRPNGDLAVRALVIFMLYLCFA
jgi:hypothetical protein